MGRDIIAAGVLGICAVIVVTIWHEAIIWVMSWPRRYLRARGYELEQARHTYAAMLAELEPVPDYRTAVLPRADVNGDPPWPELEPVWQSDLEREGRPLPGWADPEADRVTAFGMGAGSSGSDYRTPRPGAWAVPADHGTGDTARDMFGRGSEAYGPPAPAPTIPDDRAQDDTWARLIEAWADDPAAASATLEGTAAASSPGPVAGDDRHPGPGRDPIPAPVGSIVPHGPGWAPSRLGTLFDAVLAAEVSAYMQDQNRDVTAYLERLLGMRW